QRAAGNRVNGNRAPAPAIQRIPEDIMSRNPRAPRVRIPFNSVLNGLLLALAVVLHTQAFAHDARHSNDKAETYRVGAIEIEAPWTRATPGGAKVAGGYLMITNKGSAPDRLIGGSATVAGRLEVHEMSVVDGVMRMRPLKDGLEIAPGATVELKPG